MTHCLTPTISWLQQYDGRTKKKASKLKRESWEYFILRHRNKKRNDNKKATITKEDDLCGKLVAMKVSVLCWLFIRVALVENDTSKQVYCSFGFIVWLQSAFICSGFFQANRNAWLLIPVRWRYYKMSWNIRNISWNVQFETRCHCCDHLNKKKQRWNKTGKQFFTISRQKTIF